MKPLTAKQLRNPLLDLYRKHRRSGTLPTSARFFFYELVAAKLISKSVQERTDGKKGRRPDQNMLDALTWLRKNDEIPWEDIVDETRFLEDFTGYTNILNGMLGLIDGIYLDPWNGEAPLILTESLSLAGVLRPVARRYRVRIASTKGQAQGFTRTQILPEIVNGNIGRTIRYFGDFDFSGGHIQDNTRKILEEAGELQWEDMAVTDVQVEEYDLPVILKRDKRDGKLHEAVETEALGQTRIMQILEKRLQELLPEVLEDVQEREKRQRQAIRRKLK